MQKEKVEFGIRMNGTLIKVRAYTPEEALIKAGLNLSGTKDANKNL